MLRTQSALILAICAIPLLGQAPSSQAGVFNIPEFVEYSNWAVGMEPEITLSSPSNTNNNGIATTVKFTYGITPLSNLQVGLGTGSGSKGFRSGMTYSWDIIPDLDNQLGAGLAIQAYYYKLKYSYGQTETTLYPYLHNLFHSESGFDYDPYIALPVGIAFYNSTYRSIMQLVLGTCLKASQYFGVNAEIGLSLKDTDTYVAFGITYRN